MEPGLRGAQWDEDSQPVIPQPQPTPNHGFGMLVDKAIKDQEQYRQGADDMSGLK